MSPPCPCSVQSLLHSAFAAWGSHEPSHLDQGLCVAEGRRKQLPPSLEALVK